MNGTYRDIAGAAVQDRQIPGPNLHIAGDQGRGGSTQMIEGQRGPAPQSPK